MKHLLIFAGLAAVLTSTSTHALDCIGMTDEEARDYLKEIRANPGANQLFLQGRFFAHGGFEREASGADETINENVWFFGTINGESEQALDLTVSTHCWHRTCGSQEIAPPIEESIAIAHRSETKNSWIVHQSYDYCQPGFFAPEVLGFVND